MHLADIHPQPLRSLKHYTYCSWIKGEGGNKRRGRNKRCERESGTGGPTFSVSGCIHVGSQNNAGGADVSVWRGGSMVSARDSRSEGREFDSRPRHTA